MQHEITTAGPLLDGSGNLREPGYAKRLLPIYRRADIKAPASRIKEWDYYLIANDHFAVALTIDDNGYMGLDSISFLHFDQRWERTKSPMRAFPMGRTGLPESSASGTTATSGRGYALVFRHVPQGRELTFHMEHFLNGQTIDGSVTLTEEPEESMVICTPFPKPGCFYYNQKINCMRARGQVQLGDKTYCFDPADSFGVLDWGRGVWTYHNTWYWGSASGLAGGVPFGWNIGYGFGDTSAASENMLFYGGKAHKLSQVCFHIPQRDGKDDFLSPWRFTSDDGRFEMKFDPILDRAACTDVKLIKSDQHQVFGRFTGAATLDDGRVIQVRDMLGFAEKVENKWSKRQKASVSPGIRMLSLSKKGGALFDKRDFAPTRASVCASAHEHTLARHQPSGLPRPVPLGRGQRKVFFATCTPNGSPLGGAPPRKMDQTLFAACGPRTLRGFSDSLASACQRLFFL